MRFEQSIEIDAPPPRVWDVLSDLEAWPQRIETVDSVEQFASDSIGGLRIVTRDVGPKVSQMIDRPLGPGDGHPRGAFRSRVPPHERSHFVTSSCGTPRPSSRSVSPF